MKKSFSTIFCLIMLASFGFAQNIITVGDGDLQGGTTYNWTSDNVYSLNGFVFLEAGGILNIEAGTVIIGREDPSTNENASALIISRGAQIFAEGTPTAPIIFTSEIDDVTDPFDTDDTDQGFWGGLIILGNGILGDNTTEVGIEGIPAGEERALYGGSNDADNSGVLRYVSIRHGGAELSPGDEINGLTLGGVGSGTTIENIEVFANSDDGIEIFGGAVNIKGAVAAFCGDDSFDWDTGWRGSGQFWFSIQAEDNGDNGAEMDGSKPDDNARFSQPNIVNATFIGSGPGASAKNEHALLFRDGTGGSYTNSIFTSFKNKGIQVEDLANGIDSRQRLENGELTIANNIWFDLGNNLSVEDIINPTEPGGDISFLATHLINNGNTIENPGFVIDRFQDRLLNILPNQNAYAGVASVDGNFFTNANYKGAFCDDGAWIVGWTALSQNEFLSADVPFADFETCDITTSTSDIFVEENGFILAPNTPNPAHDFTYFNFSIPTTSDVTLMVMDATGKLIETVLENERKLEGNYSERYNTTNLMSGIYFYTLQVEGVRLTKTFVVK